MKKRADISYRIAIGLLVLSFLLSGCGEGKQEATPEEMAAGSEFVPIVSVTGRLVPQTWAALSGKGGGVVTLVLVEAGDAVVSGTPLVRLDTEQLEISLEGAQQEVAAQQAVLHQLTEGASDQVVTRADRENAQQVAQAEVVLEVRQQELAQARAQDPGLGVAIARARERRVRLQLAQLRAQDPAPEVTVVQVELERAKIALDETQDEYNKALDRPWEDQELRDAWAKQLEQAKLNYRSAQARLDAAQNAQEAHTIGLDVLVVQLSEVQVSLSQALEARQAYSTTLSILETNVEAAQLQLDHLRAWENPYRDEASDDEIAQATARLRQAEWATAQIESQIRDAELRAPFDGTIGAVYTRVGELISPGRTLVTLGDLTTLRVETTDLDEIDVARVSVGQQASLTFDALPDEVFIGTVTRISPMSEPGTGGVHYTAVIELTTIEPALRWGMTAFVDIEVESR